MSALPLLATDKYIIEIVSGPDKGAQFQLSSGEITIGRGDTNDIVLKDPRCSREHAVLKITPQAILIEDKGSQGGISVDGQKSSRAFISNGSTIVVGSTTFIFKNIKQTKSLAKQDAKSNFLIMNLIENPCPILKK